MAFQTAQSQQGSVAPFPQGGSNNNSNRRRADGFLNVYIPTKNGRRKVGYMPLYADRAMDKSIMDRLMAGGEDALTAFREAIQVEFSTAEADEDNLPLF